MNNFKKTLTSTLLMAMIGSSANSINAQEWRTDTGGCGYSECCTCPSLAPAIALGTIALVAIVAVAVQNSHSGASHGHDHN